MRSLIVFMVLTAMVLLTGSAGAGWVPDGGLVCSENSTRPHAVADGTGGSIITWQDGRNPSSGWDMYVQRMDASGTPVWTANGVALCNAVNYQYYPRAISDGAGGAIVAWYDHRNGGDYNIYIQRVDAAGTPMWAVDGVAVCAAANDQIAEEIVSDGAGGAIVVWQDLRGGVAYDIYAQRVDASGVPKWAADGVPVCTAADQQTQPAIVSDGAGGVVVAWQDLRNGVGEDIYAQRMDGAGAPRWTPDGVALSAAANFQLSPAIAADGAGGAIVAWEDYRSGVRYDVYAQLVDGAGNPKWLTDGVALCTASNSQSALDMAADGMGGAVVTWRDYRSGSNYDIYAQRVDGSGNTLWTVDGAALCTVSGNQLYPVVAGGTNGFIVSWVDYRTGTNYDLYAQAITASGVLQWTVGGTPVCTASANQLNAVIAWDGAGGGVVAWEDYRSNTSHVYAQRMEEVYGYWGHPEPIVDAVADIPDDQGGKVAVDWTASGRDLPNPRAISHYTIWRAVDALPMSAGGGTPPVLTDLASVRAGNSGPVYAALASVPGYYWELVGTQEAHGWPGYSFSASTRADSASGTPSTEMFMVAAHDQYSDYVAFPSNAVSGHSVDNLAPSAPLMLTAERVGNDVHLAWNGVPVPDLRDYAVYRALTPGVTPVPLNFVSTSADTDWVDTGVPTSALYYIVTASDVHENQSPPSNEVVVGTETGVGGTLPVSALQVLANRPNPFTASTLFRVGLPAASPVRIHVFDVAGRRLRTQRLTGTEGWQEVAFDGRDDAGALLPGGMYFYRIAAAGTAFTRKILIAR